MSDTPLTSFDFQFVWDKNPAVALLQLLLLQLPPYDGHLALGNAEPFAQWAPTWTKIFGEIFQIKIKMFLMAA